MSMSKISFPRRTRILVMHKDGAGWLFVAPATARANAVVSVALRWQDARAAASRYFGCSEQDCVYAGAIDPDFRPEGGWAARAAKRNAEVEEP